MKTYPRRRKAHHPRVPPFVPVPLRNRSDGWTNERQARFLAALAITRSVAAAARTVGMARETAYRLRTKRGAESFARAWDQVLGRASANRKVSPEERALRAIGTLIQPRVYRGKCTGIAQKADNSALLGHLADLDRSCAAAEGPIRRSQSFAGNPAVHAAPLPRRFHRPISAPGARFLAPEREGSR
jgi:hypothetical protein